MCVFVRVLHTENQNQHSTNKVRTIKLVLTKDMVEVRIPIRVRVIGLVTIVTDRVRGRGMHYSYVKVKVG